MSLKTTSVCWGYQQKDATATLTASNIAMPASNTSNGRGPTMAVIQAEAQALRYRDDGVDPTAAIGMLIPANTSINYDGNLNAIRIINGAAGAIANISLYS